MKILYLSIIFLSFSSTPMNAQQGATLTLHEDKLVGDCENKFYTGFTIELDSTYSSLDSLSLFNQFPRIGTVHFKNKAHIATEFTTTDRAGHTQIMFRFRSSYFTFDNLQIEDQSISFTIDSDPVVPATENDLKIIRLVKDLLSEEKYWNRADDRDCNDDLGNKSYSIYCALRIASLQVENNYNHRNAVLQKLRHLLAEIYTDKKWKHRLRDFNNMEELSYLQLMGILDEIETDFILELEERN